MSEFKSNLDINEPVPYCTIKRLMDAIEQAGFSITFHSYNTITIEEKAGK